MVSPLHNVRLGAGEGLSIEIPGPMLFYRLAGHSSGIRAAHIELRFHKARHILPVVCFQLAEDGLHPFQSGHGVIVHKAPAAQAADLVDDIIFGFEIEPDEPVPAPGQEMHGQGWA